jgi:thiol-disulfide isomerase/thioredoxin
MTTRTILRGVLITVALGCASCHSEPPAEVSPLVGKPAPDVEGELLDGAKFSLKEHYATNVVMLDFWATWCPPCVMELPVLLKIAEEYRSQGVVLFAVNQQEDPKKVAAFVKENDWNLNVVLDPDSKHGDAYVVSGIPQLVIIGCDGLVHNVHVGFAPDVEKLLRKELDALVKLPAKSDRDK